MNPPLPTDRLPYKACPTTTPAPRDWLRRHPVAAFLACVVLAFAAAPFEEHVRQGDLLEAACLTLILLSALLAVGGRRRTLAWGAVLAAPALAGKWGNHLRPDVVPAWVFLAPGLLFIILVIATLLRFILRARRIDSEVLCAGVSAYLMLGLLWSFAYILVARLVPHAFAFTTGPGSSHSMKGFTAVYFSFITLSTVGYGDIAPVSGVARMLTMMEAVTGTLYMAVMVARLVSLYSSAPPSENHDFPDSPIL
jgi:hypothetical protein